MARLHNILSFAWHRVNSDYQNSIVRRIIVLSGLVMPGFAANVSCIFLPRSFC